MTFSNDFLYKEIQYLTKNKYAQNKNISQEILDNLNPKFKLRPYQVNAIQNFILYNTDDRIKNNKQINLLFLMATGSGKTLVMAFSILYYYLQGYRNFIFFVDSSQIIDKTKDNFLNKESIKYLFNDNILLNDEKINIEEVGNFQNVDEHSINIKFTTTSKMLKDLTSIKENQLSFKDLNENKIVFLADESHHLNNESKKNKGIRLLKDENENISSWEEASRIALESNKDNVMLEFTATLDESDHVIMNKYRKKIIFYYPLLAFRQDSYTKDFQNYQTNLSIYHRTLNALLISEYRRMLFTDMQINIKPVVLCKFNSIPDADDNIPELFNFISELNNHDIDMLRTNEDIFTKNMFQYFDTNNYSNIELIQLIQSSFRQELSIYVNSKMNPKELKEKFRYLNNLEDESNKIRLVFTVDMLNEGWDVLNLFDIVRMYETRQGGRTKVSPSTISEAQLIGRGVRYPPFKVNDYIDADKRKWDEDLDNPYRVCETLLYHSMNNSKYITELRTALRAIDFEPESETKFIYKVKEDFKLLPIYNDGVLFLNDRIKSEETKLNKLPEFITKVFEYTVSNSNVSIFSLSDENVIFKSDTSFSEYEYKISEININILKKSLRSVPQLHFNKLKKFFLNISTSEEFLLSSDFLGNSIIRIKSEKCPNNIDLQHATLKYFLIIGRELHQIKDIYKGTGEFKPISIKQVVTDIPRIKMNPDREGEGVSQNSSVINDEYRLDLSNKPWFVFEDHFGTTEEKRLVKYFDSIYDRLNKIYEEIYLIRNERKLHLFSFKDGAGFEPDFILLLRKYNFNTFEEKQIFIEPKGKIYRDNDAWKEQFLLEMRLRSSAKLENSDGEYNIIGLPFYTHDVNEVQFREAFERETGI